jgi:hypothetical protein
MKAWADAVVALTDLPSFQRRGKRINIAERKKTEPAKETGLIRTL